MVTQEAKEAGKKELEDSILYNSKLLLFHDNKNEGSIVDVYDGVINTFTKLEEICQFDTDKNGLQVELPRSVSMESFKAFMRFIHQKLSKGNPSFEVAWENVAELFKVGQFCQSTATVDACISFWMAQITPQSCIDMILDIGLMHNIPEVLRRASEVFTTHFSTVVPQNSRFVALPEDLLIRALQNDHLDAPDERLVFDSIVRWIDHDKETRTDSVLRLLKCVRFMYCGEEHIINEILVHELLLLPATILLREEILLNLEQIQRQPTSFMDPSTYMLRPRISRAAVFAIGGWSSGQASALMEIYDNRAKRWFPTAHDNDVQPRAYHGLVPIGKKIYMIGGFDGTNCFNDVRCYDSETHSWTSVAPMHRERCYISTASLNDRTIFALGGYDGTTRTNTAEKYDIEQNVWTMIAPMNAVRSDACAATVNNKVFIVGGFTGDGVLPSVEYYDIETNIWTTVRSMSTPRSGVRCVNHNGDLVVLGGYNGRERLKSVEKYDSMRDRWLPLEDMPIVRSNFGIVSFENRIFAIGGFNGQTTISQVDEYDSATNTWKTVQGMTINRSALGACVCETADPTYFSVLSRDPATFRATINAPLAVDRRHRVVQ